MTRRQFADLQPGDRVRWRGMDPCNGTVSHVFTRVVIVWDDGYSAEFVPRERASLDLLPTHVDQACR